MNESKDRDLEFERQVISSAKWLAEPLMGNHMKNRNESMNSSEFHGKVDQAEGKVDSRSHGIHQRKKRSKPHRVSIRRKEYERAKRILIAPILQASDIQNLIAPSHSGEGIVAWLRAFPAALRASLGARF